MQLNFIRDGERVRVHQEGMPGDVFDLLPNAEFEQLEKLAEKFPSLFVLIDITDED